MRHNITVLAGRWATGQVHMSTACTLHTVRVQRELLSTARLACVLRERRDHVSHRFSPTTTEAGTEGDFFILTSPPDPGQQYLNFQKYFLLLFWTILTIYCEKTFFCRNKFPRRTFQTLYEVENAWSTSGAMRRLEELLSRLTGLFSPTIRVEEPGSVSEAGFK